MVSGRAGQSCERAGRESKPNVPKATSPLSATSGLECGTVAGSSRIPRHQNTTGCTSGVGHLGTSREVNDLAVLARKKLAELVTAHNDPAPDSSASSPPRST
jgi:hypothetical protein